MEILQIEIKPDDTAGSEEQGTPIDIDDYDVQTTSQQESTNRYFCPVGRSWQQEKCGLFNLNLCRSFNNGEHCKALNIPKSTKEIGGDGNCLFRALCYWVTGLEDDHSTIRKQVYQVLRVKITVVFKLMRRN